MKKHLFALPLMIAGFILITCVTTKPEAGENAEISQEETDIKKEFPITCEYKVNTKSDISYYLQYELAYPEFINNPVLNSAIQKDFLATLETGKRIGLAMTEGNMLTPVKSVTAIVGLRDITKEEELRRLRDILGSRQEINAELSVGNCAKGACEGCAMAAKCHQKDN